MKSKAVLVFCSLLLLTSPSLASRWYNMTGTVTPSQPNAGDLVRLAVACGWSDACTPNDVQVFRNGSVISLNLYCNYPGQVCAQVITSWGTTRGLGYLPEGTYDVYVTLYGGFPWPDQGPEYLLTFTVTPCPADINGDGSVDVVDLLYFVDAFGSVAGDPNYDAACDFNSDGSVDVGDLLILIDYWGIRIPPPI